MDKELNVEEKSARDLARELRGPLETIANIHYLLDVSILDPAKLIEFRLLEDVAFEAILARVLPYLKAK